MATAKKAKPATKRKPGGKATKHAKATKVVKKKVARKVAPKVKTPVKKAKAVAKTKATAKSVRKSPKKALPKAVVKGRKAVATTQRTKARLATKAKKPTQAPPKVIKKTKPALVKSTRPKAALPKTATKTATKAVAKVASKATSKPPPKAAPAKELPAKLQFKSTKAPVSVLAALERPKTPVGKQSARPTLVAVAPVPIKAVPVPIRALPKSMTVKAVHSNVLPFNPKTKGVEGYLSEAEILKQSKDKYMSKEQRAFFKQRLIELQSQLRENAGQTTEHLRELSIVPDPADRATLEEEHALELRARDRERKLLKKVESALIRIEDGSYGYCEETGDPIGIPRLLARPTATLTIEAQERRELKQRMFGE